MTYRLTPLKVNEGFYTELGWNHDLVYIVPIFFYRILGLLFLYKGEINMVSVKLRNDVKEFENGTTPYEIVKGFGGGFFK